MLVLPLQMFYDSCFSIVIIRFIFYLTFFLLLFKQSQMFAAKIVATLNNYFFKSYPRGHLFIGIRHTCKVTSCDETGLLVLILEIFQFQRHKSKYNPSLVSLGAYKLQTMKKCLYNL